MDLGALGCVLNRLLTAEPPFAKVYRLVSYCWGKTNFPIETSHKLNVSEHGIDFVRQLMAPNPSDRLSAKEALQLAWLKGVEVDNDCDSASSMSPVSIFSQGSKMSSLSS